MVPCNLRGCMARGSKDGDMRDARCEGSPSKKETENAEEFKNQMSNTGFWGGSQLFGKIYRVA